MNGQRRASRIQRSVVAMLACAMVQAAMASSALQLLQPEQLDAWSVRSFAGDTSYRPVLLDGVSALRAQADASSSGLYRERRVELDEWPLLRWRWRVQETVAVADERSRKGDDFAARVYVIASHPIFFWKTRALCYVWAGGVKAEQDWPNPYTAKVHMIALNGMGDTTGRWVEHERDVAADFKRYFGAAPVGIDAVALMTDTDQSGTSATAWYADVRFEGK